MGAVSVPSRGAIFLNECIILKHITQMVSVPSRGAIFLNESQRQ